MSLPSDRCARLVPLLFLGALLLPACRTATGRESAIGAGIGAGAGLLAADALDKSSSAGALIGAGFGALIGALHGHQVDRFPRGGVVWDGPAACSRFMGRARRIIIIEQ